MINFNNQGFRTHVTNIRKSHRLRRWKPYIITLLLLGLGYWLFFASTASKDHKKTDIIVTLVPAAKKDVPIYLDGLGTVQAYNTVTVHSQIDGRLDQVLFHEGQDVKTGDILAKIDPRTYQAQYDQAVANKAKDQATLENAKRDLSRYITLGKSVSDQTRDTQRATVSQLEATVAGDQAAIDNTKALLSYTIIIAPIDGRTGIRQVDMGNIVHAADANGLVVLTQLQPISVVFSLPQQNLPMINEQLNAGATLAVTAMSADGKTIIDSGKLELVDNEIDQTTGTIKLKSTFPNAKRALWPGGFTNVRLMVTVRKDAIVIPSAAVQVGPKNSYVFVFKADDSTVKMVPVKVAMTQDQSSILDEGVNEGDQVVTDGVAKLRDGSHVSLPDADDKADGKDKDGSKTDDKTDGQKHHHKKEG